MVYKGRSIYEWNIWGETYFRNPPDVTSLPLFSKVNHGKLRYGGTTTTVKSNGSSLEHGEM